MGFFTMPKSRQLNFYISISDQLLFEQAIKSCGVFYALKSRSTSPRGVILRDTLIASFGREPLRIILATRKDYKNIRYSQVGADSEFSADVVYMPVIEFDRCYVGDNYIRRGRLYVFFEHYDASGNVVPKAPDFVKWAQCVFSSIKRVLIRMPDGRYAGAGAISLRDQGWSLRDL